MSDFHEQLYGEVESYFTTPIREDPEPAAEGEDGGGEVQAENDDDGDGIMDFESQESIDCWLKTMVEQDIAYNAAVVDSSRRLAQKRSFELKIVTAMLDSGVSECYLRLSNRDNVRVQLRLNASGTPYLHWCTEPAPAPTAVPPWPAFDPDPDPNERDAP